MLQDREIGHKRGRLDQRNADQCGAGADLLVHEVARVREELAREAYIRRIMAPSHCGARGGACLRAHPFPP